VLRQLIDSAKRAIASNPTATVSGPDMLAEALGACRQQSHERRLSRKQSGPSQRGQMTQHGQMAQHGDRQLRAGKRP